MLGKLRSAHGRTARRHIAKIERNRNLELSEIYNTPPVRGKTQNTIMANLSISDKNKFDTITKEIDELVTLGRRTNLELGGRLLTIRDEKLWRHGGYSNFEDYMLTKWNWSAARGSQLIAGYEAEKSLPPEQQHKLLNAGQANALASVPTEDRSDVMDDATKDGSKLTAKKITNAAHKRSQTGDNSKGASEQGSDPSASSGANAGATDATYVDLDDGKNQIPPELQEEYTRNQEEIDENLGLLSKVRTWLKKEDSIKLSISPAAHDEINDAY